MEFLLFAAIGVCGGILGGMGMGGGTVLIPLLSLICGVSQHMSQALNLLAFLPMACVSLIILFKKKLVKSDGVALIVIAGTITSLFGCLLSRELGGETLRRAFGGFLVILSVFQFVTNIKKQ